MAENQSKIKVTECENLIKQIRAVISANIVLGEDGNIEEIHILAEDSRNAKQIVRDVETLLKVEYDIEIDHKKISVVQLNKEQKLNGDEKRLKLTGISYSLQNDLLEATVELSSTSRTCQGRSSGLNSRRNSIRLFAEATMKAINEFLPQDCRLLLEDVETYPLGDRQVVSTILIFIQNSTEEHLVGSALVRQDEKEAVVRAMLSAVNRRVRFEF